MAAATERIRSAARNLEGTARSLQSDMYAHCILFKMVAEDLERERDSKSVEKIRGALLETVDCTHSLEHHCLALSSLSANFAAGTEVTDFEKVLYETAVESQGAQAFNPRQHTCYEQFNQSVWNIHHAGEAAPGQEQDEIVMLTSQYGVKNTICPLSGKPVTQLDDPVRSKDCEHIYEKAAVLEYIRKHNREYPRKKCKCASAGCPKQLVAANFVCDASLKMSIQELRLRERVNTQRAQVADFTGENHSDDD
ncbi:hypothetical protein Mapa_008813 [Marchantia paleacea]|nr:hypothetical protein Mapa_008813 [Marchantia paleacea]